MKQKVKDYPTIETGEFRDFLRNFGVFAVGIIRYILAAIKQNLLLFISALVLLCGASVYYHKNLPAYYEAEMVCAFNNLHKKTYGEMVHQLGKLAESGSYDQLSNTLGIPKQQAGTIVSFEARNIAGSPLHEDITPEKLPMYFRVKTTDNTVFPSIQTALLRHLNNTPYREKRLKLDRAKIDQKIIYLDRNIQLLDSVIIAYQQLLKNGRVLSDSVSAFGDVAKLFEQKEILQDKKLEEIKSRELLQSVELVYGFVAPDKPVVAGAGLLLKLLFASVCAATGLVVFKKFLADG